MRVRSIWIWGGAGLAAFAASALWYGNTRSKVSAREAAHGKDRPGRSSHGATAVSPTDIPPEGWSEIVQRTYHEIGRDRVLAVAAGVTFYGLLALFPAVSAFVSLYGLAADPLTIADHLAMAQGVLPEGALQIVRDQVDRITSAPTSGLSVALVLSLGLSLWSANAGIKAVFDALNVAYGEDEKRSFVQLNAVSLAFTFAIISFVVVALGVIAVIPAVLEAVYLGAATEWLIWLGRWPLILLILLLGLGMLYRFGPSREDARWDWLSPGAVFAALAWLLASVLFSWYAANFAGYNETYGTLGAVIALLMWIWLSAAIVLVGAELNAETERQTLRDTTTGPAMPIGTRGADAADRKP